MNVQLVGHVSFQKLLINFNGIWYRQSTQQSLDTFYLGSHLHKIITRNQNNQYTFNMKDKQKYNFRAFTAFRTIFGLLMDEVNKRIRIKRTAA